MDVWFDMRIIMILASRNEQPNDDDRPAIMIETFLHAYYTLRDASAEVVLASLAGGYPLNIGPRDRKRTSAIVKRFMKDRVARDELADTLSVDQVYADDFDAAFWIGEPGEIWQGGLEAALIAELLASGKAVAAIVDGVETAFPHVGKGLLISGGSTGSIRAANALLAAGQA